MGIVVAAGTLFVLDASLPGGFVEGAWSLRDAQTMAFTTLMLFQIVNVLNAQSDDISARRFSNRWLWAAMAASLALQVAVVYVPVLQQAFGTVGLSADDWLRCITIAAQCCGSERLASCSRACVIDPVVNYLRGSCPVWE